MKHVQRLSHPHWPFVGHEELGTRVVAALSANRLPAVMLWAGPMGVGKTAAALWLARFDRCQAAVRPCGRCPVCRAIAGDRDPAVLVIRGSTEQAIAIETVRDQLAKFHHRPLDQQHRWLCLIGAEYLSESATNALLKFLEEPPADVQVILTTAQPEGLSATLVSRAAVYRWHLVPRMLLQQQFPQATAAVIARAAGRPHQVEWAADHPEELVEERQEIQRFIVALVGGQPGSLITTGAAKTDLTYERLQLWQLILRELWLIKSGSDRLLWPDLRSQLRAAADRLSAGQLHNWLEQFSNLSRYHERHLQPRFYAADFFMA